MIRFTTAFAFSFLMGLGGTALAQNAGPAGTVSITCDGKQNVTNGIVTANDNAACQFQNCTLAADHVVLDRNAHTILGVGHASFKNRGNIVLAERILVSDYTKPKPSVVIGGAQPLK